MYGKGDALSKVLTVRIWFVFSSEPNEFNLCVSGPNKFRWHWNEENETKPVEKNSVGIKGRTYRHAPAKADWVVGTSDRCAKIVGARVDMGMGPLRRVHEMTFGRHGKTCESQFSYWGWICFRIS